MYCNFQYLLYCNYMEYTLLSIQNKTELLALRKCAASYIGSLLLAYHDKKTGTEYPKNIQISSPLFDKLKQGCEESLRDFNYKEELDPDCLTGLCNVYITNFNNDD